MSCSHLLFMSCVYFLLGVCVFWRHGVSLLFLLLLLLGRTCIPKKGTIQNRCKFLELWNGSRQSYWNFVVADIFALRVYFCGTKRMYGIKRKSEEESCSYCVCLFVCFELFFFFLTLSSLFLLLFLICLSSFYKKCSSYIFILKVSFHVLLCLPPHVFSSFVDTVHVR